MLWAIKIILQENYDLKNREVTRQKKTPPAIVCHELVDWRTNFLLMTQNGAKRSLMDYHVIKYFSGQNKIVAQLIFYD